MTPAWTRKSVSTRAAQLTAEIGQLQSQHQTHLRRHAPGSLEFLVRKPFAQLAGPAASILWTRLLLVVHVHKYTLVRERLKG
ncbi:MAG: hypothetical protein OEY28_02285 [Nitrospira sp.]|nr:hypothetical protein [Nitrospira sp.]